MLNFEANNIAPNAEEYLEQTDQLKTLLKHDILACDIKWTLFVSAAQSFRHASRLAPYPTKYATVSDKFDIDKILKVIKLVPPFPILLRTIEAKANIDKDVLELLHWVLCTLIDPTLKSVPESDVSG